MIYDYYIVNYFSAFIREYPNEQAETAKKDIKIPIINSSNSLSPLSFLYLSIVFVTAVTL